MPVPQKDILPISYVSFIYILVSNLILFNFHSIYWLCCLSSWDVIISLVAISDEDTSVSPESRMGFTDHVRNFVNPSRPSFNNFKPLFAPAKVTEGNSTSYANHESANTHNKTQLSIPILPPTPHPCESFTLPPPPADKKRTGPRRKSQTVDSLDCNNLFIGFIHKLTLTPTLSLSFFLL